MTTAVCFKCGEIKFGAFVPCPKCQAVPQTEDDLALAMAMTDHYFDRPTLEEMGRSVAAGKPPSLDPETRAGLIKAMRESGVLDRFQKTASSAEARDARPAPRKPWWKFW
jgi:hypothetical protein